MNSLQKTKPTRNKKYLEYVRDLPCCACNPTAHHFYLFQRNCLPRAGAAHHFGKHGMGQKPCDFKTVPLCHDHHNMAGDSAHRLGRKKFEKKHGICFDAIADEYKQNYYGEVH